MPSPIEKEPSIRRGWRRLKVLSALAGGGLAVGLMGWCFMPQVVHAIQPLAVQALQPVIARAGALLNVPTRAGTERMWALIERFEGKDVKGFLPEDVPEYPGWRGPLRVHIKEQRVKNVQAATFDEANRVAEFYKARLAEAGWTPSQPVIVLPANELWFHEVSCSFLKDKRGIAVSVSRMRPTKNMVEHSSINLKIFDSPSDELFGPKGVFAPKPAAPQEGAQ